jgi:hypothetical protein
METCGKEITIQNGDRQPCKCKPGHAGGCNPFSPNPYMAVAPKLPGALTIAQQMKESIIMPPSIGVVWTDRSTTRRCLWQGPHGRCIYELGNYTEHKEETHGVRDNQ